MDKIKEEGNEDTDEQVDDQTGKFQWRSRTQHLMFYLSYIIDWGLFSFLFYEYTEVNSKYVPTAIHYIILIFIVGGPILFFQTFVGQYTRRGCIFIGEMLPIAYGLGYFMLLLSFVKLVFGLFYTSKLVSYFFSAVLNRDQPWMTCTKSFLREYSGCFDKEDILMCPFQVNSSTPCFEPHTRQFSAYFYKEQKVFIRYDTYYRETYNNKVIRHSFHMLCILPLLLIFSLKGIRGFSVSLRATTILLLGGLVSVLLVVISRPGRSSGFYMLLNEYNIKSLLDWSTWRAAFERIIVALRLAEGGHYLFGSFISELVPDRQITFYLGLTSFLAIVFIAVFYHMVSGLLVFKLNMKIPDLGLDNAEHTVFVTYPVVLATQASSYFFSSMYFLLLFLYSFHSLVLKVFVIQKTVTVHFALEHYSSYIKFGIVIVGCILTFGVELLPYYKVIQKVEDKIKFWEICCVALQIIVLLIYGFQRISDDMQFFMQSEVKTFTKLCSIAVLVLCIVIIYFELKSSKHEKDLAIRLSVTGVFSIPFVLFFFIEIFLHIRKKNIIGLLRGSDLYGPPDVEKRILRILNNPRLAVKCKGQGEVCYHVCLLKSNAVSVAVHEEIELVKTFIADLRANPDIHLDMNIIPQLEKYEKNLLKELSRNRL